MNREIKFRGISEDTDKWVYGNYSTRKPFIDIRHYISNNTVFEQIKPLSIGEFTGLKDKNGVDIYEGDIVSWTRKEWVDLMDNVNGYRDKTDVSVIEYSGHGFWIKNESFGWEGEDLWDWNELEVIGNVHQHPELIK